MRTTTSSKFDSIINALSDQLDALTATLEQPHAPEVLEHFRKRYTELQQKFSKLEQRLPEKSPSPEFISQALTTNLPNGTIGVLDPEHKIEYIGGKGLSLHALKIEDLLGKSLPDMNASAKEREALRHVFDRTLRGKEETIEVTHRDNFYKVRTQPIQLREHDQPRIMFLSQNITQEKKEQLKLQAALQASGVIVVEYDYVSKEFVANPHFNRLLGYDDQDRISLSMYLSRFCKEDLQIRDQSLKVASKTGKLNYEARLHTPQGLKWIRVSGHIQVNEDGLYEMGVGAILDITEHRGQLEKLRVSRRHFQQITDSTPTMIWMSDASKAITYLNPAWLEFTGGSLDRDLGDGWLRHLHPEDINKFLQFRTRAFKRKEEFSSEIRIRRHDGIYCWTLNRGVPLFSPEGEFQGFIGSSMDISSQKEFTAHLEREVAERTRELEYSNEQLMQLNVHLEEYAYAASHDLQEPLRKIEMFLSIIRDNLGQAEKVERYLHKGEQAASRMRLLIRDILTYNGLGKTNTNMGEVSLNALLEEIQEDFQLLLSERGATLETEDLGVVLGDRAKLYQLFTNLIKNGITYNTQAPVIKIRSIPCASHPARFPELPFQKDTPYHCIEFTDNGIGFAMHNLEHILKPFRRLHSSSQYPGTGLGLSICEKIVSLHGGFMDIQSQPGKGSRFRVYIPKNLARPLPYIY